jgi:hypothetical protein
VLSDAPTAFNSSAAAGCTGSAEEFGKARSAAPLIRESFLTLP